MATHINEGVSGGKILSWEILVESRDNIFALFTLHFPANLSTSITLD